MRAVFLPTALFISAVQLLPGQERIPEGGLHRGPFYTSKPAMVVEPARGMPLAFDDSTFSMSARLLPAMILASAELQTDITSRTVRRVPVSGITLRAAFGPTRHGMMTFRLRPEMGVDPLPEPFGHITPDRVPRPVSFRIAWEDRMHGLVGLTREMKVVFTLERLEDEGGQLVFENPDATEMLWEALGRPTLSRR